MQTRYDHRNDEPKPKSFIAEALASGWTTLIAWLVGMGICYGVYSNQSKWNEARFHDEEQRIEKLDTRATSMEQLGHPDHERRISKLETRTDNLETKFSEMNSKLDTSIAILNRVEAQLRVNGAK